MRARGVRAAFTVLLFLSCPSFGQQQQPRNSSPGKTRVYYIAADEIDWDYAPGGIDQMTGKPVEGYQKQYIERTPTSIGSVYRKAVYREYTDASFTQLKPRPPEWQHLGLVGPILQAEVGDTIKVVFKNNGTHPYSVHPHGVFYKKDSEGSPYNDGTSGADKADDNVPPGAMHTYTWQVPERAGPAPGEPSSVFWLYHSHSAEPRDVAAGLVGGMIITRHGMARPDGSPKDVDRQFVTLFMIIDENESWYMDENIKKYVTEPDKIDRGEAYLAKKDHPYEGIGGYGFANANLKATINGYLFGDGPMMTMHQGERVRWYIGDIGNGFNFHTPHWHGNTGIMGGKRVDVVSIAPLQTMVVDMKPDDPGIWLYHCHVDDHMQSGMYTRYQVLP
jgi:FtsP/CotA-like multicopper oxidase with cupredoxin domain